MTVTIPNALALGNIADGSLMVAADERNNFAAVQVGVNGLIAMFAVATTKGDLIVSRGAGVFERLPAGTDGQVLVADSTQPSGVKYAAQAAGVLTAGRGADLAAAGTIAITNQVHRVTGATTINTINGFADGAVLMLIAYGGTGINIGSGGNIAATAALGTRAVPDHAAVTLVYDTVTGWHVAGVGS